MAPNLVPNSVIEKIFQKNLEDIGVPEYTKEAFKVGHAALPEHLYGSGNAAFTYFPEIYFSR